MSTLPKLLTVEPIVGELGRFHVSSRRGNLPYLVDLDEYEGKGFCACEHFQFRIQPKLERGEPVDPCAHIQAALEWMERN